MRTHNDFKELNYNEVAFFLGIPALDAKHKIADLLEDVEYTAKGAPKLKLSDKVPSKSIDFKFRSNSSLDGKCKIKYLCDYFNNGTDNNHLREYSENPTYIKAVAFTGKNKVLNEILNEDQLMKLQKTWLVANVLNNKYLQKNAASFIRRNAWAKGYLEKLKGINIPALEPESQPEPQY